MLKWFAFVQVSYCLIVTMLTTSSWAVAGTEYYYSSDLDSVTNIVGNAFADQNLGTPPNPIGPAHQAYWAVWGETDAGVSRPITGWNLGDFTGAPVPMPLASYQVGFNPASYGGSAVEIHTMTVGKINYPVFGAMINTWNFPRHTDRFDLAAAQVCYRWDPSDDKRPWAHGPASVFHFSFLIQVPSAYAEGGTRSYLGPVFTLEDTTHKGHYFWFELNVFDTGPGVKDESISWDPGTAAAQVGSPFASSTRYVSKEPSSFSSTTSTWVGWHWYGFSVSRSQLVQVITDLNKTYPAAKFSTNPDDYKLGMIMIDAEISWPTGNANLAYSASGINVYSEY